ncbi:hypothetical protein [Symbiopectobacterium sp. RP]
MLICSDDYPKVLFIQQSPNALICGKKIQLIVIKIMSLGYN